MASPTQGTAAAPIKKAPRSSLLRSCERCRKRKIRCDDFFPCATCTRIGVQCKVPNEERRGERSQSYLEQRVKRLESLLAQQEGRDEVCTSRPMRLLGPKAEPSDLRLQIPPSPALSFPQESDLFSNHMWNFQESPINRSMSYCSSPVDFPSSPAGDLPPWSSSDAFDFDQSMNLEFPRRANSFPFTLGKQSSDFGAMRSFPDTHQDHSLAVPDIPIIEVTSWDQQSNASNDTGMNDHSFNLPDLSVGSWSIPPSPSLTALSHGQDDHLFELDLHPRSRRSSMAFSDRSFDGFDFLKPETPLVPAISHSRPRSRSDVLPQSIRALNTTSTFPQMDPTLGSPSFLSSLAPGRFDPNSDNSRYARTFFDHVHPFYPILSPQTFQSYVSANMRSSEQLATSERLAIFLVLAIGSQFESNIGRCSSSVPARYYNMAQQFCPRNAWQQSPSLTTIEINLLHAVYALLSAPSLLNDNELGLAARTNIWMLNALISASAIDLNLHQRADLDDHEMNLFSLAYMLDKTVGLLLARPHLLREPDIDIQCLMRVQVSVNARRAKVENLGVEQAETVWKAALRYFGSQGDDITV